MPHIPTKEEMIAAVRKSKCPNLKDLPLEEMTAEDIAAHLLESRCPCYAKLVGDKKK